MGGGNLGDAAIQDAVIAHIRRRVPDARIVAFSFIPPDTAKRHGIPCYPLTREWRPSAPASPNGDGRPAIGQAMKSSIKKVRILRALARPLVDGVRECAFLARSYKTLRSLDVLIMSGGGQLCELWGGPWAHLYNVFKFSVLARLARRRLYYLNVGVEPLEHRLSRFFARCGVQLADYVSFRDVYSQTLARELGVKAKTHVHPDPAYALETSAYVNGGAGSTVKMVGINPLGYCDPRIWPRKDPLVYDRYLGKLTQFSVWLRQQGYALKFFTTSVGVDKYAVADLKRRVLERCASDASTVASAAPSTEGVREALCGSVSELLGEMAECDFIVTSRYHGVIFSHLLRKPVIALSYQGKSDAAMQPAGLEDFAANIEHFEIDWLMGAFRSLVRGRDTIKGHEASAVAACAALLQRQFDDLFPSPARTTRSTTSGTVGA